MTKRLISLEGLLMRPRPEEGESWPGYLCRLADCNGIFGIQRLARVLGTSRAALLRGQLKSESSSFALEVPKISKGVALLGSIEFSSYLSSRICPICIEQENSICKSVWDGPLALRCIRHSCMLVDRCDGCREEINYKRPNLMSCVCGKQFRTMIPQDIPPWLSTMESAYSEALAPSGRVFTEVNRAAAKAIRFFSLSTGNFEYLSKDGYSHHINIVRSSDFGALEKSFGENALGFSMRFKESFRMALPNCVKHIRSKWQVDKFNQILTGLGELRNDLGFTDPTFRVRMKQ